MSGPEGLASLFAAMLPFFSTESGWVVAVIVSVVLQCCVTVHVTVVVVGPPSN